VLTGVAGLYTWAQADRAIAEAIAVFCSECAAVGGALIGALIFYSAVPWGEDFACGERGAYLDLLWCPPSVIPRPVCGPWRRRERHPRRGRRMKMVIPAPPRVYWQPMA